MVDSDGIHIQFIQKKTQYILGNMKIEASRIEVQRLCSTWDTICLYMGLVV